MSNFALIANGVIAQIEPAEFPVNPAFVWADISTVTPAPLVGWSAVQTNGAWTFTAPPTAPGPTIQQQAKAALADSDTTMHRISEGVILAKTSWTTADVVAFVTWRTTIRTVMNGTASPMPSVLPARPAYPAGT